MTKGATRAWIGDWPSCLRSNSIGANQTGEINRLEARKSNSFAQFQQICLPHAPVNHALSLAMAVTRSSPSRSPTKSVLSLTMIDGRVESKRMACSFRGAGLGDSTITGALVCGSDWIAAGTLATAGSAGADAGCGNGDVAWPSSAAGSRTVSVRETGSGGETPPELAGEDACATRRYRRRNRGRFRGLESRSGSARRGRASRRFEAETSAGSARLRLWATRHTRKRANSATPPSATGKPNPKPRRAAGAGSTGRNCNRATRHRAFAAGPPWPASGHR